MSDKQIVSDFVANLELGRPVVAGALTLFPLTATSTSALPPAYLMYDQTHAMGLISIQEVGEDGIVGELKVANRANQPVLLVEGQVLLGMKQARVLNLSILVAPHSTLKLPVSCVEAGRWRAVSSEAMGTSDAHLAPSIRAAKTVAVGRSMRGGGTFDSDQQAVWAGVDRILAGYGAHAPTRSYADLPARMNASGIVDPEPGQVGVIACVHGRIACADVFEAPQVLASVWPGLLASYHADAYMTEFAPKKPVGATRWFRSITAGSANGGPSLGLGDHVTVVAPGLEAAALVLDGRVVHLSAFPAHEVAGAVRFAPPTRRRS